MENEILKFEKLYLYLPSYYSEIYFVIANISNKFTLIETRKSIYYQGFKYNLFYILIPYEKSIEGFIREFTETINQIREKIDKQLSKNRADDILLEYQNNCDSVKNKTVVIIKR